MAKGKLKAEKIKKEPREAKKEKGFKIPEEIKQGLFAFQADLDKFVQELAMRATPDGRGQVFTYLISPDNIGRLRVMSVRLKEVLESEKVEPEELEKLIKDLADTFLQFGSAPRLPYIKEDDDSLGRLIRFSQNMLQYLSDLRPRLQSANFPEGIINANTRLIESIGSSFTFFRRKLEAFRTMMGV